MKTKLLKIKDVDPRRLQENGFGNDPEMVNYFKKELKILKLFDTVEKDVFTELLKQYYNKFIFYNTKNKTIDHIIKVVCAYFGIDQNEFLTKDRVQQRQIVMYLCKRLNRPSLNGIRKALGYRNHSSVIQGYIVVKNLMDVDKKFKKQVEELEKIIF